MLRERPCSRSKVLFLAAAAALILTLRWGERGLVNHVYNIVTRLLQVQSGRGLISRSIALLTTPIYLFVESLLPLPSSLSRCSQLMESTQLARSRSSGRDWWRRCSPTLTTLESAVSKVELGVGLQLIILVYSTKTPPSPPPLTKPLAGTPICHMKLRPLLWTTRYFLLTNEMLGSERIALFQDPCIVLCHFFCFNQKDPI